ncbi:hypothetical protein KKG08_00025 [Patescibacteria group bacterium]|nr:hypothetical protein [Patescibacteria group bacterium]
MSKIRVGFDFDGVIVNKPPLISKKLVEKLFKGCRKGLHYRFPGFKIEQLIRKLSHFYLFRPPFRKNLELIKELGKKEGYELYLVTSRYSFLESETYNWIKKRGLNNIFSKYILNTKDEQPHIFKKETLKKLNLDYYFEDDPLIVKYLGEEVGRLKVLLVTKDGDKNLRKMVSQ